jgi:hypothetical protein
MTRMEGRSSQAPIHPRRLAIVAAAAACSSRFRVTERAYEEVALSGDGATLAPRYREETVEYDYGLKSYRRPLVSSLGKEEVSVPLLPTRRRRERVVRDLDLRSGGRSRAQDRSRVGHAAAVI